MSTQTSAQPGAINLMIEGDHGVRRCFPIQPGETLMIGSGSNCGIQLDDPKVSAIHCLVRHDDGAILVQDWCTALGTIVDGARIEDEASLQIGSVLQIGRYRIMVSDSGSQQPEASRDTSVSEVQTQEGTKLTQGADAVNPAPQDVGVAQDLELDSSELLNLDPDEIVYPSAESAATIQHAATHDASPPDVMSSQATVDRDVSQESEVLEVSSVNMDSEVNAEAAPQPANAASLPDNDTALASRSKPQAPPKGPRSQAIDPETVSLLEAEIECLQLELAERDRQLTELSEHALNDDALGGELPDASKEVDRLVTRLDSLLDELARNDQRIAALEELLHAEQELARNQEEERGQMEGWLKEIEVRITAREDEWKAEKEVLMNRVEQLKADRDAVDQQVNATNQESQESSAQANVIAQLREQVDQLQQQAVGHARDRESLQQQLESLRNSDAQQDIQQRVEDALREERLALAQERADLSRQRAEAARQISDHVEQPHVEDRCEADQRFLALRATLKEIHQQDVAETAEVAKPGLATRLAELWRRLDGPTDTD